MHSGPPAATVSTTAPPWPVVRANIAKCKIVPGILLRQCEEMLWARGAGFWIKLEGVGSL